MKKRTQITLSGCVPQVPINHNAGGGSDGFPKGATRVALTEAPNVDIWNFERKAYCLICGVEVAALYPGRPTLYCSEHKPRYGERRNGKFRASVKRTILERDEYRCIYCGEPTTGTDHVLAVSMNGPHTTSNGVACCPKCNTAKTYRLDIRGLGHLQLKGEDMAWVQDVELGVQYDKWTCYAYRRNGQ